MTGEKMMCVRVPESVHRRLDERASDFSMTIQYLATILIEAKLDELDQREKEGEPSDDNRGPARKALPKNRRPKAPTPVE